MTAVVLFKLPRDEDLEFCDGTGSPLCRGCCCVDSEDLVPLLGLIECLEMMGVSASDSDDDSDPVSCSSPVPSSSSVITFSGFSGLLLRMPIVGIDRRFKNPGIIFWGRWTGNIVVGVEVEVGRGGGVGSTVGVRGGIGW